MEQIITYLTFNGNCREAMEFYQRCLGGELEVQSVLETPEGVKFPDSIQHLVMQATLRKDDLFLMGTDLIDEKLINGNSVSILVKGNEPLEIEECYRKLQVGGLSTHPLKTNQWGGLIGGLTDKYGHHWLFHCKSKGE